MNAAGTCGGMRSSGTIRRFSIENVPISSPSDDSTIDLRFGWYSRSFVRSCGQVLVDRRDRVVHRRGGERDAVDEQRGRSGAAARSGRAPCGGAGAACGRTGRSPRRTRASCRRAVRLERPRDVRRIELGAHARPRPPAIRSRPKAIHSQPAMRSLRRRCALARSIAVGQGMPAVYEVSPRRHAMVVLAGLRRFAAADATADMPDWSAGPRDGRGHAVREPRRNGKSLEWIVAEAPFEIAEKSEDVLGLDAIGAPLYVPGERVPAEPDTVAAFGDQDRARDYVVTGWFDRLGRAAAHRGADLEDAEGQGEGRRRKPQEHGRAGELSQDPRRRDRRGVGEGGHHRSMSRAPSGWRTLATDVYPVFMMGRGLGHFTGALAAMSSVFGSGAGAGSAQGPDLEVGRARSRARGVPRSEAASRRSACSASSTWPTAAGDPKLIAKATGKFNYAADLAPDDIAVAARGRVRDGAAGKWEVALDLFAEARARAPVGSRGALPARRGAVADRRTRKAAEHQLEQVTANDARSPAGAPRARADPRVAQRHAAS